MLANVLIGLVSCKSVQTFSFFHYGIVTFKIKFSFSFERFFAFQALNILFCSSFNCILLFPNGNSYFSAAFFLILVDDVEVFPFVLRSRIKKSKKNAINNARLTRKVFTKNAHDSSKLIKVNNIF